MRSLCLDVGDRKIGVAISDPQGIIARPLTVIYRDDDAAALAAIIDIVVRERVVRIIVGLPRSLSGAIGAQAEKVTAFAGELARRTAVPIAFRDERLSTVAAKRLRRGRKGADGKVDDDAVAAAFVLQAFLEESPPGAPLAAP